MQFLNVEKKEVFGKPIFWKLYNKEAITRNYDACKPRLRRLKGVNIGGCDGELCVRKIRSIKSSIERPFAGVIVLSRTFATRLFPHSSAHALNASRCVTDCRFSYLHFNNSSLPLSRRPYVLRLRWHTAARFLILLSSAAWWLFQSFHKVILNITYLWSSRVSSTPIFQALLKLLDVTISYI